MSPEGDTIGILNNLSGYQETKPVREDGGSGGIITSVETSLHP